MTTTKVRLLVATLILAITGFPVFAITDYRITSWNYEWLSSVQSDKIATPYREQRDYQALAEHFEHVSPDILAFQEVNDTQALMKVIGNDYEVFLSDRAVDNNSQLRFSAINQYTGFAVRRGVHVEDRPDVRLDDHKNSKLRFASQLVLNPNSAQPIYLVSVHLKAGCSGAYKNQRSCRTLKSQALVLNQWIAARELNQQAYVIFGDFNHNLAYSGDWMWRTLSQGNRAQLATESTAALCQVRSRKNPSKLHQFRSLIDHIVIGPNLSIKNVEQSVFATDAVVTYQLSDHCPISATLSL